MDGDDLERRWQRLGLGKLDAEQVGKTISPATLLDLREDAETEGADSLNTLPDATAWEGERPQNGLEVRGVLGEGGMGQVQLALQRSLQREVAVKRLRGEVGLRRQRYATALLWEARVMGALEHPNITPIHELGIDEDGSPLLVMKRISGESWRQLLGNPSHPMWANLEASGRSRRDIHLDILGQLCNALYYAHSFGIVHRDIKPENVMLGAFGEVYLVDWGTAMRLPCAGRSGVVGTPAYMAPEMAKDDEITAQTDVYLLGATLYEVLGGKPPHHAETVVKSLWRASENRPNPLPSEVPAELVSICERAMHTDRDKRFDSPATLRQALELFRQHHGSREAAQAAIERGDELLALLAQDPIDREAVYRVAGECRFGLRLALRQWPDNEEAHAALQRCLGALFDFEIRSKNAEAAQSLLAELDPGARTSAQQALEALRQDLAAEGERVQKLAMLVDQRTGSRARALTFFAASLIALGISARAVWLRLVKGVEISHVQALWSLALLLVLILGVIAALWRRFGGTPVNRRFLSLLVLTILSLIGNRLLGVSFGRPISQTFVHDLWVIVILSASAGIALNHWGWWLAGFSAVGAVFATIYPQMATLTLNVYGPVALLFVAYMAIYRHHEVPNSR